MLLKATGLSITAVTTFGNPAGTTSTFNNPVTLASSKTLDVNANIYATSYTGDGGASEIQAPGYEDPSGGTADFPAGITSSAAIGAPQFNGNVDGGTIDGTAYTGDGASSSIQAPGYEDPGGGTADFPAGITSSAAIGAPTFNGDLSGDVSGGTVYGVSFSGDGGSSEIQAPGYEDPLGGTADFPAGITSSAAIGAPQFNGDVDGGTIDGTSYTGDGASSSIQAPGYEDPGGGNANFPAGIYSANLIQAPGYTGAATTDFAYFPRGIGMHTSYSSTGFPGRYVTLQTSDR
jgi:hypothetical protein